ncbi:large-conductance mechanosensitive channel protein MscL [Jeotgalibacillus haloalkalitolerans]|uniref:Large-conductance mechanosensitive channel n=1 Tax=Jeotgalibacillus haloalkalitolerans TaxID=3104292 RepID=A0ABU5KR14_9BACL|nr:large-conductance mechanosensitive channel protein MscL [Jeotgalibacillus sp. HH7-29]MDZ5713236.1 large-conductance mechanosensitive channel protein MscL [Jeotgalibacillus sp. HH7-29]
MMKEFREFAMRGNVLELAIAVVLGAAFGKIVTALVENIIMPIVGIILGGVNFSALAVTVGNAVITYGIFIQAVIDFIIVAFAIFLFVKVINRFKRKEEAKEAAAPVIDPQTELLTEIRDLLKKERV